MRTHGRGGGGGAGGCAEWPKLTNPVCNLMQFKMSRTHRQTDRHTHTQTHRAYIWLQVPPFKLTLNVRNDNGGLL